MARSNSHDFAPTGDELLTAVLRLVGAKTRGQRANSEDLDICREAGNMILKQWSGPTNRGIPGFKAWQRSQTTLTLTATASYTLRLSTLAFTSGGTYTIVAGDTITGATSAATATVIAVSTTSGTWAAGTAAGTITLTSQIGTFAPENLNVGASTNVATIAGNSSQAGGGKDIYPPTHITMATLKEVGGIETPMYKMMEEEYRALPLKTQTGTPTSFYYERNIDYGTLYLDTVPATLTDTIVLTYLKEIDDIDSAGDSLWIAKEYLRALKFAIAADVAIEFSQPPEKFISLRDEALAIAGTFEPENVNCYFEPDRED